MSDLKTVTSQYAEMRTSGKDSKTVLLELRMMIGTLNQPEREELVRFVREWETSRTAPKPSLVGPPPRFGAPAGVTPENGTAPAGANGQSATKGSALDMRELPAAEAGGETAAEPPENVAIKPLSFGRQSARTSTDEMQAAARSPFIFEDTSELSPLAAPEAEQVVPAEPTSSVAEVSTIELPETEAHDESAEVTTDSLADVWEVEQEEETGKISCPQCGKKNHAENIFCYACGFFLVQDHSPFETRTFDDGDDLLKSDEYFGADTALVFVVKSNQQAYKLRPQNSLHEIIIGRDAGGTMKPDLDLNEQRAAELGVSRMHLTVTYNANRHTISVSDMGSSNGTFINGQRLHPQEVRVLRNGDELRLGRLVLSVFFYHPKPDAKRADALEPRPAESP